MWAHMRTHINILYSPENLLELSDRRAQRQKVEMKYAQEFSGMRFNKTFLDDACINNVALLC